MPFIVFSLAMSNSLTLAFWAHLGKAGMGSRLTCVLGVMLLLVAFVSVGRAEHYEVFLLAGQSNMDGRGPKKDLTGELAKWAHPQPDVLISFSAGGLHRPETHSKSFEVLAPGFAGTTGSTPNPPPTGTFGPEISFGRTMADGLAGKHVALIKFAEGGTSLQKDWDIKDKEKLFEKFIGFTNASLQKLKDRGDTYEIQGMIWHQGESDEGLRAGQYQTLLTDFIGQVRERLGVKDLPFVIGEVYDNGKRNEIIAGQRAAAEAVSGVSFISSEGLTTFDHGTHFDAVSQIELGKRFAQPLLKLLAATKK